MAKKSIIQFNHGTAVKAEFPEHRHWFIPDLVKHINQLLKAGINHPRIEVKDHLGNHVELLIADDHFRQTKRISYDSYHGKLDQFIVDLTNQINQLLIGDLKGHCIVSLRTTTTDSKAFIDSNLYLALANRNELQDLISDYYLVGSKEYYLDLLSAEDGELPAIEPRPSLDKLAVEYKSGIYEADHYLPIYPGKHFPDQLTRELETILSLNPENKIHVEIDPKEEVNTATGKTKITLTADEVRYPVYIDKADFYFLGTEFNKLLKNPAKLYCLLQPDEDTLLYAFLDKREYEMLKKHDYVNKNYLTLFEGI